VRGDRVDAEEHEEPDPLTSVHLRKPALEHRDGEHCCADDEGDARAEGEQHAESERSSGKKKPLTGREAACSPDLRLRKRGDRRRK